MDNSKNLWIAIAAISIIVNIFFAVNLYSQAPIQADSSLYIQDADSARLSILEDGTYELSMQNSPNTLTFTDRPRREFGSITSMNFVDALNQTEGDPPNAVLQVTVDGEVRSIPLEMMEGMAEELTNSAAYVVKPLPNDGSDVYLDITTLSPNQEFLEGATLYVDAFPTSVNNQITDSVTQTDTENATSTTVNPQVTDSVEPTISADEPTVATQITD